MAALSRASATARAALFLAVLTTLAGLPPALAAEPAAAAEATPITVFKSPTCACCAKWVDHLRAHGFSVRVHEQRDLAATKVRLGVPPKLWACHSATVGGYVIEGHVPASDIRRLLRERPKADGLAVPGMPIGSPGMEVPGRQGEPYAVHLLRDGKTSIWALHNSDGQARTGRVQNQARTPTTKAVRDVSSPSASAKSLVSP